MSKETTLHPLAGADAKKKNHNKNVMYILLVCIAADVFQMWGKSTTLFDHIGAAGASYIYNHGVFTLYD